MKIDLKCRIRSLDIDTPHHSLFHKLLRFLPSRYYLYVLCGNCGGDWRARFRSKYVGKHKNQGCKVRRRTRIHTKMLLSVLIFSKNKSMSVWILNLNIYLEHPLIGIYFFFNEKIFFIYLFFYQKPVFYNKIHKVVNYHNIPVRFY